MRLASENPPRRKAGSAAAKAAEQPAKRVVVRFLTDSDFPPFNFYDEDGVLVGFNVDLARAICLELATSCDIKARPWEELFNGLKSGEADAVIAAHKVTAKAMADVDFTERYFHTPGRFAGRKETTETDISPPASTESASPSPRARRTRHFSRRSSATVRWRCLKMPILRARRWPLAKPTTSSTTAFRWLSG